MPKPAAIRLAADAERAVEDIKKLPGVQAIYLFGSVARGRARPYSDIDICVMAGRISDNVKSEILASSSRKIDTHLFSELPLPIQFRVFREGRPLYIKKHGEKKVMAAKWLTLRRYQDFKPHIDFYTRRILGF